MKKYLVTGLLLMYIPVLAQIENRNLFPTPNAANLGLFGQVPVDYFNGLPQISVPLYEFKSGGLNVPVSISYHAGGIKPSDHASWVGLGWSLQAGGAITRIVNDLPDEYIDLALAYTEYSGVGNPQDFINANADGFFYNTGILSDSYWTNTTLATEFQLLYPNTPTFPSSLNYSLTHRKDKAPDEFAFNFLGMSGSLFMGQDGKWKIKSKQGVNFKVDYVTGPYLVTDPHCTFSGSTIYNCLTKFILTSNDGTQYFFGADTISNINATSHRYGISNGSSAFVQDWGLMHKNFLTDDSTAIEFTRINAGGGDALKGRDGGTVPISWYLTKIKSVTGDSITLKYTRDGYQIINSPAGMVYQYSCPTCYTYSSSGGSVTGADDQLSILDGVSLSSINGVNGSVQFQKSKANILDYTIVGWSLPQATLNLFCAYGWELFNGQMSTCSNSEVQAKKSTFMKLDVIKVVDNNQSTLKSINFSYNENPLNRLFLNSVTVVGSDGTTIPQTAFTYNNIAALAGIPYETSMVDHWGYYNGVNPFCSYFSSSCSGTFNAVNLLNPSITAYQNSRTPNQDSMQVGILTGITYPTGGNSQFVWEANRYSKTIAINGNYQGRRNSLSINVIDQNNSSIGAGVRIKQINSQAGFNAPLLTKNYFYDRDYVHHSSNLSSGVLNGSIPNYIDNYSLSGVFSYNIWTSYNRTPMHLTNGSLITYTKVTEQNNDGSLSEFTYSNHDNGYLDKLPTDAIWYTYTNFNFQDFVTNSMELERGLTLTESNYKQDATLLLRKAYQYNNDANRFSSSVRKYLNTNKFSLSGTIFVHESLYNADGFFPSNPIYQGADIYALEAYVYYPYLQSDTITQYDQNGLNPLTTVTNYTYDNYRNKKTETSLSSKLETLSTTYNYATDNITSSPVIPQGMLSSMNNANMIGMPVEKFVNRNNVQVVHTRTDYQMFSNYKSFIVPVNSYSSINNNLLENAAQYINYDIRGNILEFITRDGITKSFDWGYNREYPTVKIENAANSLDYIPVLQNVVATNSSTFNISAANTGLGSSQTITQTRTGDISFSIPSNLPTGANVTISFTLSGPVTVNGYLCNSGSQGASCGGIVSSIVYNNMPAGVYTITSSANTSFGSYSFLTSLVCSYQSIATVFVPSGIKEFFSENFEENSDNNVIAGNSHTGKKFWNANYTASFIPPNNRNYTIQWWNLSNSKWILNQQGYSPNMVLSGPVDDIRIFPSDAYITTYTYAPLIGMTSQTDPAGHTIYYEYDVFNRLKDIRDQNSAIVKQYDYEYQQAIGSTGTANFLMSAIDNNTTHSGYQVTLTSVSNSSVVYTFTINMGANSIGPIPAGAYNILITPASSNYGLMSILSVSGSNQLFSSGASSTFSNITVGPNNYNTINIY